MRIRSIKPEFWDDADLATDLSREQRLLYIGLWNLCYDNWTMEYDPRQVKRAIFGYDEDVTVEMVAEWVSAIVASERAVEFVHSGHKCLYLPKCAEHQRVNRPTASPIPQPDSCDTHAPLNESSVSPPAGREGRVVGAGSRSEEGTRETGALLRLPTCLNIPVPEPSYYSETFPGCTIAEAILRRADETFRWNGGKPIERNAFIAVFTSGCFSDCSCSEAQAWDCLATAFKGFNKCSGSWPKSRRLFETITVEDRERKEGAA